VFLFFGVLWCFAAVVIDTPKVKKDLSAIATVFVGCLGCRVSCLEERNRAAAEAKGRRETNVKNVKSRTCEGGVAQRLQRPERKLECVFLSTGRVLVGSRRVLKKYFCFRLKPIKADFSGTCRRFVRAKKVKSRSCEGTECRRGRRHSPARRRAGHTGRVSSP
jgi:hypothetical protein